MPFWLTLLSKKFIYGITSRRKVDKINICLFLLICTNILYKTIQNAHESVSLAAAIAAEAYPSYVLTLIFFTSCSVPTPLPQTRTQFNKTSSAVRPRKYVIRSKSGRKSYIACNPNEFATAQGAPEANRTPVPGFSCCLNSRCPESENGRFLGIGFARSGYSCLG